jgi:DNA-binding transcriptional MerR regulator
LLPDKLYYSITELANHFDVAPSLLRYWESEFHQIKPKRNAKGTRFYTKEDISQIEKIYFLVKEQGFTLQGAKDKLRKDKKGVDKHIQVVQRLENVKAQLLELRQGL